MVVLVQRGADGIEGLEGRLSLDLVLLDGELPATRAHAGTDLELDLDAVVHRISGKLLGTERPLAEGMAGPWQEAGLGIGLVEAAGANHGRGLRRNVIWIAGAVPRAAGKGCGEAQR